jgi:diguanylate cyclase (GGDEF)-like protein/PAS domain S-box-containing protein
VIDTHLTVLHADSTGDGAQVREALDRLGHRVSKVDRFEAGVTRLEQLRPQLLIVDDSFDGGRCVEFIARVRSSRHGEWAPILMTAAGGSPEQVLRRAIEAGADDGLLTPLDPSLLGLRLLALQRIAAALSGLRAVIDNVREAVILIDGTGVVRAFNAAAEEVFQYTADEVIGRNVSMLMPSPFREQHDRYIASFLQTRQPRIIGVGRQVIARRKNGDVFPAHLAVSAIPGSRRGSFVGLMRDLTAERERERLAHLALHDPLTGLPNRAHFMAAVEDEAARARQSKQPFALLFIDVNDFKQINDRHGHGIGDAVLATVAGRLQHSVCRHDIVARLAGDEFVVLLRGVHEQRQAEVVAMRLRDAVGARLVFDACELHAHISIGIALFGTDGEDVATLMEAADRDMYRAKRSRTRGSGLDRPAPHAADGAGAAAEPPGESSADDR